ncbi:MAG: hypothetical protein NC905_05105, partial [Candidatus Omnitrophica bacterium]|nr:hypothetical protein [Candidatus Omnitrophota bacterium]
MNRKIPVLVVFFLLVSNKNIKTHLYDLYGGENMNKKKNFTNYNNSSVETYNIYCDGKSGYEWKEANKIDINNNMTVIANIEFEDKMPELIQTIISKWQIKETFKEFEAFDAGKTEGLDTTGFLGAIFDGRYIYFVPQCNTEGRRHGYVLRYDTHSPFKNQESWESYNAEHTSGLNTVGYYGAAFDGRYIYFVPRISRTKFLRYDTKKPFKSPESWSAFDLGLDIQYQGCGYDGRYIYFAPGGNNNPVLRYDTKKPFNDRKSYET